MKFSRDKQSNTQTTFDWHELVRAYEDIMTGTRKVTGRQAVNHISEWEQGGSFYDATSKEMIDRIHNGFEFDYKAAPESLPNIEYDRPRMRYTDDPEGEYSHDLYITGETEHFLTKPKRKSVGGLRLRVQYNWNCAISKKTIAEYTQ